MALCEVHWFSKTIAKHVGMYVFVPDEAPPPFRTFYLLHGLSDDYTIWVRRTSIERYALAHNLIVVMPDGFRGFYTDNASGPPYGAYLGQELVEFIDRMFPTKRARTARGVGGLSMGGYGALRLALAYPETFAAATSHSGALLHGSRNRQRAGGALGKREFTRIFGKSPAGSDHDILALASRAKAKGKLPRLRIDCGVDDFLLDDNRQLHAKLDAMRIGHEYEEFPGGHNWEYWDVHVQDALAFHAKQLK